jgi:hypothetical protein
MPKYTMEMVLEYAKVFPENADMGNPDGPRAAQAVHQKGGQYTVNAYFTSEDQIQELVDGGLDLNPMNSERIKTGNEEYGIGKFINLKRPVPDNIKTFENKNGPVEVNYGGAPGVVNLTEGKENKRWWSFEEDGYIGNGSKATVQFETYAQGAGVRLKNIGVTEHVPYEPNTTDEGDELFNMES